MRSEAWFHYAWVIAALMALFIGPGRQRREPERVVVSGAVMGLTDAR